MPLDTRNSDFGFFRRWRSKKLNFWFEEYWGSILLRRADSSEDLGVVGVVESLTLSRVAVEVIVLFHDQMIRKSDDFTIWWWSDDCSNQSSQLWSPFWGGEFRGLFEGWHGSWDDCIVLYHHHMIMIILSKDDQMVVLTDDLILTGTRTSWPSWRMTWQLSWFERVADGHWMGGF